MAANSNNDGAFRRLKVRRGESMNSIYKRIKKTFTAADLQRFTEIDEGIPAEKVLSRLEKLAKKPAREKKKS
jgi:hypothetical protein